MSFTICKDRDGKVRLSDFSVKWVYDRSTGLWFPHSTSRSSLIQDLPGVNLEVYGDEGLITRYLSGRRGLVDVDKGDLYTGGKPP